MWFGAKNQVLSEMIQKGSNGPKKIKNMLYWSFGTMFDPFRPLLDIGKPAMFGHFWSQKEVFGPPLHMIGEWQCPKLLQTNFLYG